MDGQGASSHLSVREALAEGNLRPVPHLWNANPDLGMLGHRHYLVAGEVRRSKSSACFDGRGNDLHHLIWVEPPLVLLGYGKEVLAALDRVIRSSPEASGDGSCQPGSTKWFVATKLIHGPVAREPFILARALELE